MKVHGIVCDSEAENGSRRLPISFNNFADWFCPLFLFEQWIAPWFDFGLAYHNINLIKYMYMIVIIIFCNNTVMLLQ